MREKTIQYKPLSEQGNHMICPNCGTEVTAEFTGEGKPCPKCGTRMLFSGYASVGEAVHPGALRELKKLLDNPVVKQMMPPEAYKEFQAILQDAGITEIRNPLEGYAKAISAVPVQTTERLPNGVFVVIAPCRDYDDFKKLPAAIKYNGRVYGKTGWNSDRYIAYYRTDAKVAMAV